MNWNWKKISTYILVALVIATFIGIFTSPKTGETAKAISLSESFSPEYSLYLNEEGMSTQTKYTCAKRDANHIVFLAQESCAKGNWSCIITLDLKTFKGNVWEEYDGKCKFAVCLFTPGSYGEYNIEFVYENGKIFEGRFVPLRFQKEHTGLIRSLAKGLW